LWRYFANRKARSPCGIGGCSQRRISEKEIPYFFATEASKSMKTNDRPCKIGAKQTGFCAEMTRISQKKLAFLCFLSVGNAFWRIKLAKRQGGLAGWKC
jgi:hypothetical protein